MPRPSSYSETVADVILDGLWEGKTLTVILAGDDMPAARTISDWCANYPDFGRAYKAAMVGGAFALIEQTTAIVDNLEEKADSRKVRAWQRFELAKRKAPHVLGDRLQHANDPDNPMPAPQWIVQPVAPAPSASDPGGE